MLSSCCLPARAEIEMRGRSSRDRFRSADTHMGRLPLSLVPFDDPRQSNKTCHAECSHVRGMCQVPNVALVLVASRVLNSLESRDVLRGRRSRSCP